MEVEIKLNVLPGVAGGPAAFFDRLRRRRRLGPFRLGLAVLHTIRDVYYDTPDRRLGAVRAALRLRELDGHRYVTLKLPRRREGALAVREESEAPLTAANLQGVLAALVGLGVLQPGEALAVYASDFAAAGPAGPLRPVLDATTRRIERSVSLWETPIAALALDVVRYAGLAAGPFYDVEAEATGSGGEAELARLQALLLEAAGGALAPGTESKLARGLRLLAER